MTASPLEARGDTSQGWSWGRWSGGTEKGPNEGRESSAGP